MRIENRIRELSSLLSTMGEGGLEVPLGGEDENAIEKKENQPPPTLDSLAPKSKALAHAPEKLRAIIELKVLCVRKKLRAERTALCYLLIERTSAGRGAPHCATRQGEVP